MLYAGQPQEYDESMQESLVKLVLALAALVSLAIGVLFLVFPGSFVTVSEVESVNLGWLRSVGASVIGLQGFGLLVAAFRRRDTNLLLSIVALVTTVQAGATWFSVFAGEFSTMRGWAGITLAVLATLAAVLLWLAWLSRRKSVGSLPARGRKKAAVAGPGKGGAMEPPEAEAELVEEIDAQSPRFSE